MHPGLTRFKGLAHDLTTSLDEQMVDNLFSWIAPAKTSYPSDISDDHTPYEFSIADDGGEPEVRLLCEVQAEDPNLQSNWGRACKFNEMLVQYGANLDRFELIKDLFYPRNDSCKYSLWHAFCFRNDKKPDIKLYVNPQCQGKENAFDVVSAALTKLGFIDASRWLLTQSNTELKYFSLDLTSHIGSRVKVYTAHPGGYAADIEAALSCADNYVPGQVSDFCTRMADGPGPYNGLPVQTTLSFTQGHDKPTSGAIHFPLRSYYPSDYEAIKRLLQYMGDDTGLHFLNAFSDGALERSSGRVAYASLRQYDGPPRVTMYLASHYQE